MATSYTDAYHLALIAGMRQIFGDPAPAVEAEPEVNPEPAPETKPKSSPRGKAVQAANPAEAELTTEGVETK